MLKQKKLKLHLIDKGWIIRITIVAFLITLFFSISSEIILKNINIFLGIFIIIFFIIIGVIFDMIGIAVATSNQKALHAMASKKIRGSKLATKLSKNAEKVSAFCNDVIGDICNIMSGGTGIMLSVNISNQFNLDLILITLIITSLIAGLTIGGKAIGKTLAINISEIILLKFAKIITIFYK